MSIKATTNKDVHILVVVGLLNRQRAGEEPRQYRYLSWPPWSDAATYPFGRPIANRSQCARR